MDLKERLSGIFKEIQRGLDRAQISLDEAKEEMTELERIFLKLDRQEAVANYNRHQKEQGAINKAQEVVKP